MMENSNQSSPTDKTSNLPGLVPRPPFQLRSLPIETRWEVTRRHPYYQVWWILARQHHQNAALQSEFETYLRQLAVAVLDEIGVSGCPVDPATEFGELDAEDLQPAWLSGAVHPISLRGLAAILMATLPAETLGQLGLLLCEASQTDKHGEPPNRIKALQKLLALDAPGLNDFPDEPFVSINPAASARQISEALSQLAKDWKAERELPEKRPRPEKYAEYLKVWDLREGWVNGSYDRSQERTLFETAAALQTNLQTTSNHYRKAFELITGQSYSPELWVQLMGQLKLSELIEDIEPRVSRKRPLKSRARRAVPESRLSNTVSDKLGHGVATGAATAPDDADVQTLVSKINSLIGEGYSDQEIADSLELSSQALPAIETLRDRHKEGLGGSKIAPT